ncbi:uncharacterized protein LOC113494906 [Trichoplusia ni]|uniref:Uncharacterized protein LOC113494906 n=1 Tax=Trichoplusia ni TaxID=7111 RepID=A0A7E5VM07_TRINI|nr:uncharacterized protein LOC113494906 [Trichoplusia ni]
MRRNASRCTTRQMSYMILVNTPRIIEKNSTILFIVSHLVALKTRLCYVYRSYVHLCQRRISAGRFSPEGKGYVVYLINTIYSEKQPLSWLCGGTIVSSTSILTSAACLKEISHMYVIAGYQIFMPIEKIKDDECIRRTKKRIVTKVIPKDYDFTQWIKNDLGVGIVNKPYDFTDQIYKLICTHMPVSIDINYEVNYEKENINAVAYGWGSSVARKPGSLTEINRRYMKEGQTVIVKQDVCTSRMDIKIESNVLCAYGPGILASDGRDVAPQLSLVDRRFNLDEDDKEECFDGETFKENRCAENQKGINKTDYQNKNKSVFNFTANFRRQFFQDAGSGICENDHGGPLVSWVGQTEILIGVAMNSLYTSSNNCAGPFLYTSTARSRQLLNCLLNSESESMRHRCKQNNISMLIIEVQWPVI